MNQNPDRLEKAPSPPRDRFAITDRGSGAGLRIAGASLVTALLVVFLVALRIFDSSRTPEVKIRPVLTLEAPNLPAPPPPPDEIPDEPPPPPPPPKLPKLEIQLDQMAPAIKATVENQFDPEMIPASFEYETDPVVTKPSPPVRPPTPRPIKPTPPRPPAPTPVRSVYSASEIDSKPRMLNRPTAPYPSNMLRRGIREARVLLEVSISTSGRVSVRRVLSSPDPEFSKMAQTIASRARFSVPKKNGRPVTAIYKWPLILRP